MKSPFGHYCLVFLNEDGGIVKARCRPWLSSMLIDVETDAYAQLLTREAFKKRLAMTDLEQLVCFSDELLEWLG